MSEVTFRQPARRLSLVVGIAYVVVFLVLALTFFDQMSEVVNSMAAGGYQATGFLVGAVCVLPLIALIVLARQKVTLRQDYSTLRITIGRREQPIPRRDIHRIVFHEPALGPVRLYDATGSVLATLNPPPQKYPAVVGLLTEHGGYSEAGREPVFRGRMTAVTLSSDSRS